MTDKLFTVGHSTLALRYFVQLLKCHGVQTVVDVRSHPYSKRSPHFDRPPLEDSLKDSGIVYVFGGKYLGGRPRNVAFYAAGQVQYDRMEQAEDFRRAIRKLIGASRSTILALMCAEADPLECHRFLLIGRYLSGKSVHVEHILSTGELEPQVATEKRLLQTTGLLQADVFSAGADAVAQAYSTQAQRVAFIQQAPNNRRPSSPPTETP